MHSTRLLILILLIASILVGGCTPLLSHSSFAVPAASKSTGAAIDNLAPQPSSFPRGRFRAITPFNPVVIVLENHGLYRVFIDNALVDSGQFVVQGSQLLVDSAKCGNLGNKPAAYSWYYDEETGLDFQLVGSDPCPERRQYLSYEFEQQYLFIYQITQVRPTG